MISTSYSSAILKVSHPGDQNFEMDFTGLKSRCWQDHGRSGGSAESTSPENGSHWSMGPITAIAGSQRVRESVIAFRLLP